MSIVESWKSTMRAFRMTALVRRNPHGTNNSVRRATVARSGNAGIVTSQLSNELAFVHVHGVGTIGRDDAGLHADNSRAPCGCTSMDMSSRIASISAHILSKLDAEMRWHLRSTCHVIGV